MDEQKGSDYHPVTIVRLWSEHHLDGALWRDILDVLKRHPDSCDEIWFATARGYPALDVHSYTAERMACAAAEARAAGFLPGIQIGSTVGHADRPMLDLGGADFQVLVGQDGTRASGCFCPRGTRLGSYFAEVGAIYAALQPSSIWIDDDLRLNGHPPIDYGCFCDRCLGAFSGQTGHRWDRPSLVRALNHPTNGAIRMAWTRFNDESMAILAHKIAKAVHAVAPHCTMGIQTCPNDWSLYNGRNYTRAFEAMSQETRLPVGNRPGVLVYTDHAPREMVSKAFGIGRSVAMQPGCVSVATAEIENYPHVAMGKTPEGTAIEASLDLALGCNSVSFAVVCNNYEPMTFYERILERIGHYRAFWAHFLALSEGTYPGGLNISVGDQHASRPLRDGEGPFEWSSLDLAPAYQMACVGLPLTVDPRGAQGTILHSETVPGFTDGELGEILTGGVVLDGYAAMELQKRGLDKWLGVTVEPLARGDCRQRFTDDPVNAGFEHAQWRTYGTQIQSERSLRELAFYETADGSRVGTATALVENALGGRMAVVGHRIATPIVSGAVRSQLIRAADWVCAHKLPIIVETAAQVVAIPRVTQIGELASVFLLNATIDQLAPLQLCLRGAKGDDVAWHTPHEPQQDLSVNREGSERRVRVPPMPPWSIGYLSFRG